MRCAAISIPLTCPCVDAYLSAQMTHTAVLGYPRMGAGRELKKALERYWSSDADEASLRKEAARIRSAHWKTQSEAGIDIIPSGDFSFYDHVLDTAAMVGAVPPRYGAGKEPLSLPAYFAMARGSQAGGRDVPALEMTKWFDTNYHYIVPEISADQRFRLAFTQAIDHFSEAAAAGVSARPVILGPVTFLSLAKSTDGSGDPLRLLDGILPVYTDMLERLARAGASWVQVDEPVLVTDLTDAARQGLKHAYAHLASTGVKIMLTTYFGDLGDNLDLALKLPVSGLHVDLVRGTRQGAEILRKKPSDTVFSLGLAGYYFMKKLLFALDPPGFATLIVAVFFLAGVQLITIGVMAEYVGRISDEVKRRPMFIIRRVVRGGGTSPS